MILTGERGPPSQMVTDARLWVTIVHKPSVPQPNKCHKMEGKDIKVMHLNLINLTQENSKNQNRWTIHFK